MTAAAAGLPIFPPLVAALIPKKKTRLPVIAPSSLTLTLTVAEVWPAAKWTVPSVVV